MTHQFVYQAISIVVDAVSVVNDVIGTVKGIHTTGGNIVLEHWMSDINSRIENSYDKTSPIHTGSLRCETQFQR